VHTVAAQAIVHQVFLPIVLLVEKDFRVSGAVRTRGPTRVFLLVAISTSVVHLESVPGLQPDVFGQIARNMVGQPANVFKMKSRFQREHVSMAGGAGDISMRGSVPIRIGLPNLVAASTGLPLGVFVVQAATRKDEQNSYHSNQEQCAKAWCVFFSGHGKANGEG
jgi:hypothetical protein